MKNPKPAYLCAPLTDLPEDTRDQMKAFYERLADACTSIMGSEAYVPHLHTDPVKHANIVPAAVYELDRAIVCEKSSVLVAVYVGPSWGCGIEIALVAPRPTRPFFCRYALGLWLGRLIFGPEVPVILLVPEGKKASRMLLGCPAIRRIIRYKDENDALLQLARALNDLGLTRRDLR
ncbi:MAG: hypothetical protein PHT12_02005 [Patescibacteria group bacterium]|nr:hypothetical protein [Patescibacteria group bacterium]